MSETRRVAAAAIRTKDGVVHTLPPPARHHHIIARMPRAIGSEHGFALSDGSFVSRHAAETVARASGQLAGDLIGSVLTTEDLW